MRDSCGEHCALAAIYLPPPPLPSWAARPAAAWPALSLCTCHTPASAHHPSLQRWWPSPCVRSAVRLSTPICTV